LYNLWKDKSSVACGFAVGLDWHRSHTLSMGWGSSHRLGIDNRLAIGPIRLLAALLQPLGSLFIFISSPALHVLQVCKRLFNHFPLPLKLRLGSASCVFRILPASLCTDLPLD